MIIIAIASTLFSFLLMGMISNYQGYIPSSLSWFQTIYPLVALLILAPYFENKKKLIALVIITGLLTDIIYSHSIILNACLFATIYYFSKTFHFFFPYNLLTINISNLLSIFIYHIISFLILLLLRYDSYNLLTLGKILSHSILMTIIYTSIIYLLIDFIYKKFELKEIK